MTTHDPDYTGTWRPVVNTLTKGQPSRVSRWTPQITIAPPGVIKVGAKSPQNRRLQQSRAESAKAHRASLPTVPKLIAAGFLPAGFRLLPSTHRDAGLALTTYRAAADAYKNRNKPGYGMSAELLASHAEEAEWAHKNADPKGKGTK